MRASCSADRGSARVPGGSGPGAAALAGLAALFALTGSAYGQSELVLPPSADVAAAGQTGTAEPADEAADSPLTSDPDAGSGEGPEGGAAGRPGEARLAEPERTLPMEEVIVVNESEWRLPDLGSAWREAHADAPETGRISVAWVPLYDPADADPVPDLFQRNSELYRVGMIELVRVRFGGRPKD